MNIRLLFLALLVGAAALAAHNATAASADPVVSGNARPTVRMPGKPSATATVRLPETAALTPVASGAARVRHVAGTAGARLMGPSIIGMTERTNDMLEALQPAIQKAMASRRQRAEKAAKQIRDLDETAISQLAEGRPVAALRSAMRARQLIDVVRHQVIEESIR
jgi:hypothetical protein